jgi:hypothetical protein
MQIQRDANCDLAILQGQTGVIPFCKTGSPMPGRDLTDIRPERIGASLVEERIGASLVEGRNTAFTMIAGIIAIALAVGYAGYCFYTTAEMINKKTYDKLRFEPPRSL